MTRSDDRTNRTGKAVIMASLPVITLAVMLVCIGAGSVSVPLSETLAVFRAALTGAEYPAGTHAGILLSVRLPRVLNVALVGASLSLCGAAMQGLMRNPLADGSTLGISSGASLGAVLALMFGVTVPGLGIGGTVPMAILTAFLSLLFILALAYALDSGLSTNSLILTGMIYTMFVSGIITLLISFSGDRLRTVTFWTMGSLSGTNYGHTLLLAGTLLVTGTVILRFSGELDAFALGEDNARHIGVNVRRVRLILMAAVSVLIGVCVSVSGTIGFVGLVTPHMTRRLVGASHGRLLPASLFTGAIFLLLADLVARTAARPVELSVGAVTSLIGAVFFIVILLRGKRGKR